MLDALDGPYADRAREVDRQGHELAVARGVRLGGVDALHAKCRHRRRREAGDRGDGVSAVRGTCREESF